ncbi:MAG TPA: Ig-like domain repeat protein, partial [Bryobacteraceae bacterium]|nr:Ig-like domain repeat protein [Bryobacteraceae bacterium]
MNDGRTLVAGGMGDAGPVSNVDVYGADGAFTAAPAMQTARANAACTTLSDGRVLVTGGNDGSGAVSTAEIYDPVANAWQRTGSMSVAREGHKAVATFNGDVWIAGGVNQGSVTGVLEVFTSGKFHAVGTLNTPRSDFAMAASGTRNLLIAGGTDGTNTLDSVESYDGLTGSITVAGTMSQARRNFAAAALLDGRILLIGGIDASGNTLSNTEIFDAGTGSSIAGPALLEPRANHVAYALPGNGRILILGGTGNSTVLGSTEIYTPWTGAITAGTPLNAARRDMAQANLRPGSFLIVGGRDDNGVLSSSELFRAAAIVTDKPDYAPGTAVKISGAGWVPGEQVLVQVEAFPVDQHRVEFTGAAVADGAGNITLNGFAVDKSHLGMKFLMTATGSQSEAQSTFTDALPPVISLAFSPTSAPPGTTVQITVTVSPNPATPNVTPLGLVQLCEGTDSSTGTCPSTHIVSATGYTCTPSGSNNVCTLATGPNNTTNLAYQVVPAAGTTFFGINYLPDSTVTNTYTLVTASSDSVSYTSTASTTTAMTAGPTGNTPYGSTTPYQATVTVSGGGTPTGTVTFCDNAAHTCSGPSDPTAIGTVTLNNGNAGVASFVPTTPLAVGTHTIVAYYAGDPASAPSLSSNAIVTNIVATGTTTGYTLTAGSTTAVPLTAVFSQPVSGTATVTAQSGGGSPTGTVTFSIDSGAPGFANPLTSGTTGAVSLGNTIAVGPHTVTTVYAPAVGSGWSASSANNSGATALTITQAGSSTAVALTVGGTATPSFLVTVTGNAPATSNPVSGTVTLYDGVAGNIGASTLLGTGTLTGFNTTVITSTVSLSSVSNPHSIWAAYAGNASFTASNSISTPYNNTTQVNVSLSTPVVSPNPVGSGDAITISGTATAASGATAPTGTLTFCISTSGGTLVYCAPAATLSGNTPAGTSAAQVTILAATVTSSLPSGAYTVKSTYSNLDGNFVSGAISTPASFTVSTRPAPFTVTANVTTGQNVVVSSQVTFTATVGSGLSPNPTGTVTFINSAAGNAVICTATLVNGVASCTATTGPGGAAGLQAGPVTASITYPGDTNYSLGTVTPFLFNVTKFGTVTTLTPVFTPLATSTVQLGTQVTLTAATTATGATNAPSGTFTFTLPVGTFVNPNCGAQSGNTFTVTPSAGNMVVNGSQAVTTVTCSFTLVPPSVNAPTGVNAYSAVYNGDIKTQTSTGTTSFSTAPVVTTLSACTTTISICIGQNPQTYVYGQPFSLNGTLTAATILPSLGPDPASQAVAFSGGGINVTAPLVASATGGTVSIASTSFNPAAGTYILTARYPSAGSDPYYAGSSASVTFTITKANSVTTLTNNGQGQITVVVSAVAPGSGVPTGSVLLL